MQPAKRSILLLELLIGLFLIGTCALPLIQIPMRAMRQESKANYRIQMHHYADLTFASIKEKFYKHEIPWEQICHSRKEKTCILDDQIVVELDSTHSRKFARQVLLYSVGKQISQEEECRLVTLVISFKTIPSSFKLFQGKKELKNKCRFTYQLLINRTQAQNVSPT